MNGGHLDIENRPGSERPVSDVPASVGLVGLATLLGWLASCRNWASIGEALSLPGPRAPLSGPYAALASVLLVGLVMSAWSVLIDKVHRNPSTGIDWHAPRPWRAALSTATTKIAGLWVTWAGIGLFYCIARWYWDGQYVFAMDVLAMAGPLMALMVVPYVIWLDRVLIEPRDASWHFGAMLIGDEPWDGAQVARHWRAWAIKGFFGAFMISILPGGFEHVVETDFATLGRDPVAIGGLVIALLFLVDVQIGTVGYIFTFRPLDAHIRSGNPLLGGWVAALLCYPPFVWGTIGRADVLGYEVNTQGWAYWMHGHTALEWSWAALMVALTAIYAWATFAFGLRFSNLTYRGVLTNGPYRFTRHPAYLSKNLFWWTSTLPFLVTSHSLTDAVRNTVLLGVVSGIYYWRAKTEEAHLLAEDPKYRAYHAWMAQNAPITHSIDRIGQRLRPRSPAPVPVE